MNIYYGPTGHTIREERNHRINQGKAAADYRKLLRKRRAYRFNKLHRAPNPMAHRTAIFKARHNIN